MWLTTSVQAVALVAIQQFIFHRMNFQSWKVKIVWTKKKWLFVRCYNFIENRPWKVCMKFAKWFSADTMCVWLSWNNSSLATLVRTPFFPIGFHVNIPSGKMRYLISETKFSHDFPLSGGWNIEECNSAYEKKNSKCLKKIPEDDCNFIKFQRVDFFFFRYLKTKFGTDFSVSGSCNIEEFDSIYENKIKKLQMPKKIPENDWNFIKLQSFSGIFFRHLEFYFLFS